MQLLSLMSLMPAVIQRHISWQLVAHHELNHMQGSAIYHTGQGSERSLPATRYVVSGFGVF